MRLSPSFTLPDEVERARAAGQLVIFAGAGVSVGAPASLPTFLELARRIAEPAVAYTPEDRFRLDHYLGRAERHGVIVQQRARDILESHPGKHNPIHEYLVGLFPTPAEVRLITTNFDAHFSRAASAVFPLAELPRYSGPALPLGKTFRGIVHLHGSLKDRDHRLVLTQQDFAAAYITEGWATRFLTHVFAHRTILFAGYSLGDPVLQYLISALEPTDRWFALSHEDEAGRWTEHDIRHIAFATRADGAKFGDLEDGLKRWQWFARASMSEHDSELKRLIALGPPSSSEDTDYIVARLGVPAGRVTFWTNATEAPWFAWAANRNLLDGLTDVASSGANDAFWIRWCLTNFTGGSNPALLQYLRRRSLNVSATLARELTHHLFSELEHLDPAVLRQLVALLVARPWNLDFHADLIEWLFKKLVEHEQFEAAFAILRSMTQVHLKPLEKLHFALERAYDLEASQEDPSAEASQTDAALDREYETRESQELRSLATSVQMACNPEDIRLVIAEVGAKLASVAAREMAAIGVQRIGDIYSLVVLARGDQERVDLTTLARTAIAPSDQDTVAGPEDVLVEVVTSAIDYWAGNSQSDLAAFANQHSRHEAMLVRRLSLYAFGSMPVAMADDLLQRSISDGWATTFWLSTEYYRLLRLHFAAASREGREALVAALRDAATWGRSEGDPERMRFDLSQLLESLAPSCPVTVAFADQERSSHPGWLAGEGDGSLIRSSMSWGSDAESPLSVEQMHHLDPTTVAQEISRAWSSAPDRDRKDALRSAIQEAAKADPEWAIAVLIAMSMGAASESPVLEPLASALYGTEVSLGSQLALVERLRKWVWPEPIMLPLGSLLDGWTRAYKDNIGLALLDGLDEVAAKLFERSALMESSLLSESGYLDRAINHPAGHAVSIWINVANSRDWNDGRFALTLDDSEKSRWRQVIVDRTNAGLYGRAMLGVHLDRLSVGDYAWSQEFIFPAFDPDVAPDVAAPLWDGRLFQQHWSWSTVRGLRPHLRAFLRVADSLVPARSRQLGDWVGLILTHPEESKFGLSDLQHFITYAEEKSRRTFADRLPGHLDRIAADERSALWTAVLRPYWHDRRTNVPVALSPEEVAAMVRWVISLPEVADEVLVELGETPGQSFPDADRAIRAWREDDRWIRDNPEEAVSLIGWLGQRQSIVPWNADRTIPMLELALQAGVAPSRIIEVADILGGLPCQVALDLANRLRRDL